MAKRTPEERQERAERLFQMFENAGITPVVIDPNNSQSVERGAKEITERISQAASEIQKD